MKILDLFCGAGGASEGIHRAFPDAEIHGVDNNMDLYYHYKFHFHTALVQDLPDKWLKTFDVIWASPPCQSYSYATTQWKNLGYKYPDMVEYVRERLLAIGKPFVIENVPNSPVRKDITLCMSMFDDGREFMVRRHRVFEIHGFDVIQPFHPKHEGRVGDGRILSVFGHGGGKRYNHASSKIKDWQVAMGIDWTNKRKYLAEAIPPEYSQYIFSFIKEN